MQLYTCPVLSFTPKFCRTAYLCFLCRELTIFLRGHMFTVKTVKRWNKHENFSGLSSVFWVSWAASKIERFCNRSRNTPLLPILSSSLSLSWEVAWQGLKSTELGHEKDPFTGPGFSPVLPPPLRTCMPLRIFHHTLHCNSPQRFFDLLWSVIVSAEWEKKEKWEWDLKPDS